MSWKISYNLSYLVSIRGVDFQSFLFVLIFDQISFKKVIEHTTFDKEMIVNLSFLSVFSHLGKNERIWIISTNRKIHLSLEVQYMKNIFRNDHFPRLVVE